MPSSPSEYKNKTKTTKKLSNINFLFKPPRRFFFFHERTDIKWHDYLDTAIVVIPVNIVHWCTPITSSPLAFLWAHDKRAERTRGVVRVGVWVSLWHHCTDQNVTTAPANVGKKKEKKIESVLKRVVFCVFFFSSPKQRKTCGQVQLRDSSWTDCLNPSSRLWMCARACLFATYGYQLFFFMSFFPSVASDDIMKLRKKRD